MSATNPTSEIEALVHVIARLSERYPAIGEAHVREMVAEELVEFDGAWVRAYVPVLIEGRVLSHLRALNRRVAS